MSILPPELKSAFASEDETLIEEELLGLDLDDTEAKYLNQALLEMVTLCYQHELSSKTLFQVFKKFDDIYGDYTLGSIPLLFTMPRASDELLTYICNTARKTTYAEIFNDLLKYKQDEGIIRTLNRVMDIYNLRETSVYRKDLHTLYHTSQKYRNFAAMDYFEERLRENPAYAPAPLWLLDLENPEEFTEDFSIPVEVRTITSVEEAVAISMAGIEEKKEGVPDPSLDINQIRKDLTEKFTAMSLEEINYTLKDALLTEAREKLIDNEELFHRYGPCHPRTDLTIPPECVIHGGCRMFLCTCFEHYQEEDDVVLDNVDWFTGTCTQCCRGIANRYYAVRRPLEGGGWEGCYCSLTCIEDFINKKNPTCEGCEKDCKKDESHVCKIDRNYQNFWELKMAQEMMNLLLKKKVYYRGEDIADVDLGDVEDRDGVVEDYNSDEADDEYDDDIDGDVEYKGADEIYFERGENLSNIDPADFDHLRD